MNFIWGILAGIGVATIVCLVWMKTKKPVLLDSKTSNRGTGEKIVYQNEDEAKKQENLAKIESYIANKERFTNDELQNILGVSDTTIGRYLEELESTDKIKQVGKTGKFVYYTKK